MPKITMDDIESNPVFSLPVNMFIWSTRTRNCLENEKIEFIGELIRKSEAEMLCVPNFGRACLNEVKQSLSSLGGLSLNTDIVGAPSDAELISFFSSHKVEALSAWQKGEPLTPKNVAAAFAEAGMLLKRTSDLFPNANFRTELRRLLAKFEGPGGAR
jgi:hypothetical protein